MAFSGGGLGKGGPIGGRSTFTVPKTGIKPPSMPGMAKGGGAPRGSGSGSPKIGGGLGPRTPKGPSMPKVGGSVQTRIPGLPSGGRMTKVNKY